jgi:hypothetical protein
LSSRASSWETWSIVHPSEGLGRRLGDVMCSDCGVAGVRMYLDGIGLCDRCADKRNAEHTGSAPLAELPGPLLLSGPDGWRHRLAYRAMRVATGVTVSLEEQRS